MQVLELILLVGRSSIQQVETNLIIIITEVLETTQILWTFSIKASTRQIQELTLKEALWQAW